MKDFFAHTKIGILGTIIFHVIIIALLIIFGFTTPLPLPEEESLLINFGTQAEGSGLIEPENTQQSNPSNPENQQNNDEEINKADKTVLTQNFEESATIKTNQNKKNNNTQVTETNQQQETEQEQKVNEKAMFPGNNNSNNNSPGDGNSNKTGNQGDPNGSPDSKNYNGSPNQGSGVSFSLTGRGSKTLKKPDCISQEEGKVVVEVTVDRYGNVTKAIPGEKGTTTTNKTLWDAAKKAALNSKFTEKIDAPEEQKGTITYHFLLQ